MGNQQHFKDYGKIFFLGSTGNLGKSLIENFEFANKVVRIPRRVYDSWWDEGKSLEINEYFSQHTERNERILLIFAQGIVQKEKVDLPLRVNFMIPRNVLESLKNWNVHSVTIGSVHEDLNIENFYLNSKRKLVNWMTANQINTNYHFKLHTLYGGHRTDNQMLLPQVIESLQANIAFELRDGSQLREYHHFADVSRNIWKKVSENSPGFIEISAGESILISDLARCIFEKFDKTELLTILPFKMPTIETQSMYSFTPKNCFFYRDPMSGVIQWMDTILKYD